MKAQASTRGGVVAQPLYAQVRERLLERIVSKEWKEGHVLPNEFDLARQFGVSIGTIRKAVEGLEAGKIVVRKQGRGTFVSRGGVVPPTEPVSWFGDAGLDVAAGTVATLSIERRGATPQECSALLIEAPGIVIAIRRRRLFPGEVRVIDAIALPQHLFFDFDPNEPLPGNLYEFYGDYFGIRAVKCRESISAAAVEEATAPLLGAAAGAPVLKLARTSYSASGEPIEWRESLCALPQGVSISGPC